MPSRFQGFYNKELEINDLLRDAHPFGGTQVVEESSGEGYVEDSIESQMLTLKMVAREPTLKTLASLGDYLDDAGLTSLANQVDDALKIFAAESAVAAQAKEFLKLARIPDQLIEGLRSERRRVRMSAIANIAKINDPSSVELIEGMLNDRDSLVRATAVDALTRMGSNESLAAIEELGERDTNRVVQEQVEIAKERLFRPRITLPTFDPTKEAPAEEPRRITLRTFDPMKEAPAEEPGQSSAPGRAKSRPSTKSRAVYSIQNFLVNLGYPVRSREPRLEPDGMWGRVTNKSLAEFIDDARAGQGMAGIQNADENKVRAEALDALVSANHRMTANNINTILKVLTQPVEKARKELEKPKQLYRINFTIDGKEIENFPITYLLNKMNVGNPSAVAKSTIYMIEFLKAYGAINPGQTNWETIQVPFTKAVAAISKVLDKEGYTRLQSYMAPMEAYIVDKARETRERKEKMQAGKEQKRSILDLLDGLYPGGSEYHKVRQSQEATRRFLAYLANDLKFSDQQGNLTVSEGRVRGSLAKILDYAKGMLYSMQRGRVTAPPSSVTPTQQPNVADSKRNPPGNVPTKTLGV